MKKWIKQNPQANAQRKAVARKRFRAAWEEEKAKDTKFDEVYEKKFRTMRSARRVQRTS